MTYPAASQCPSQLTLGDGHPEVPQAPGLGMVLNWGAIDEKTEHIIAANK